MAARVEDVPCRSGEAKEAKVWIFRNEIAPGLVRFTPLAATIAFTLIAVGYGSGYLAGKALR